MNAVKALSAALLIVLLAACDPENKRVPEPLLPPPAAKEPAFASVTVAGMTIGCAVKPAQPVGQEQEVAAISVETKSSTTGSSSNVGTYTPPSGWVVVSHRVEELFKNGIASMAVNTQPAGWSFALTEEIESRYSALIGGAVKKGWSEYAARLRQEQEAMSRYYTSVRASHHNINAVVRAQGSGFPSYKPGAIGIRVHARVRYTGVDNLLGQVAACHQQQLGL